jgi:cephalosporin hydroxylase
MPHKYTNIMGWFDFEIIYQEAVNKFNHCTFVEIGSFMGKSVCYLAELVKENKKDALVVSVDLFPTLQELDIHATIGSGQGDPLAGEGKFIRELPKSLLDTFVENLRNAGVDDVVIPIKSDSHKAARLFQDNSIAMVFVDAGHSYDVVLKDLELWWPKVIDGGIFAGHDRWDSEVDRAVRDFTSKNGLEFRTVGNSWLIHK